MSTDMNVTHSLLPNIQTLYEKLQERQLAVSLRCAGYASGLIGAQFYTGQPSLSPSYLYIAESHFLESHPFLLEDGFLVVIGECGDTPALPSCSCIIVSGPADLLTVFNEIQQVFTYYTLLEKKINNILNRDGSLYDISVAALEHFHNPVFIHDEYFHILACPQYIEGAMNFTYNEQTKRYMQDLNTVNAFRTSPAYKKTLTTIGGQFWDSDFNNDKCIYANIWINGNYRGRFILTEAERPLTQGQLSEATYFSEVIKLALQRRNNPGDDECHPMEKLIVDVVSNIEPDRLELNRKLENLGWSTDDQYMFGIISFENSDVTKLSVYSICNDIEERLSTCHACYHKGYIYLLVNLTRGRITQSDLRMKMSYIIREGLLRMGVSSPFGGNAPFCPHLKQAHIALRYSQKENVPHWYNDFHDYVLKFWLLEGTGELNKNDLAPGLLHQLHDYDKQHGTDLYNTLKTYLITERNSTLTSQLLKINRSTLPHRLNRIAQFSDANLDDFETRLYLLMGFYALDYIQ